MRRRFLITSAALLALTFMGCGTPTLAATDGGVRSNPLCSPTNEDIIVAIDAYENAYWRCEFVRSGKGLRDLVKETAGTRHNLLATILVDRNARFASAAAVLNDLKAASISRAVLITNLDGRPVLSMDHSSDLTTGPVVLKPVAAGQKPPEKNNGINLLVDYDGTISWNGRAADAPTIARFFADTARHNSNTRIIIFASRLSKFLWVAQLVSQAQHAGFKYITLLFEPS